MGENIYTFVWREMPGALKRAWGLERDRLQRTGQPVWSLHNEILQPALMTLLLWTALVLAFAFDPQALGSGAADGTSYVSTDAGFAPHELGTVQAERSLGKLPVLLVRMNNDLVMGDDLKKTGAGNLFTVFGEPDIDIRTASVDGVDQVVVEVHGVDVYDPTTGIVRSQQTDQIALWMIDTNYNEESFFVRHCYFTGGNDPYARLKRALKAAIDEDAWASLYSTVSRPFARPDTGKIAVKVINDYGDEVMQVFDV